jgi:hypothetical protein
MRIRIQFRIQLINFDPVPDFYFMRMQIQVIKIMRIRIHNTVCCGNLSEVFSSLAGDGYSAALEGEAGDAEAGEAAQETGAGQAQGGEG